MSALALVVADFCDWLADEVEARRLNGRAPDVPKRQPVAACPCRAIVDITGSHHHSREYRCGVGCCV